MMTSAVSRALVLLLLLGVATPANAQAVPVERIEVTDFKSIYGEVRSRKIAQARTRIAGTVASLNVGEGDSVAAGQVVATIGDPKIELRIEALDAQVSAMESEVANALAERDRMAELFERNVVSQAALDRMQTAFDVVSRRLDTVSAERRVLIEQLGEGEVLSPSAGRVLHVPASVGSVVGPGETIAEVAAEDFVLRLSLPQRHARTIAVGDPVLVARDGLAGDRATAEGRVALVYPDVTAGRVIADAEIAGLGSYFVGERIQAWLAVGAREAIVIPRNLVVTRSGVDFVMLTRGDAPPAHVVVRLGPPLRDDPGRIEVLSGLRPGDALVRP